MTDLLLNIVLDRSGSMEPARDQVIAGYNELIKSQKNEDGETYVSLTLFETEVELRHIVTPLADVPLLSRQSYRPGGWTALFDAIGNSIRAIEEARGLPERILFVVQTDGHENSSTIFSQKEIFDLVKRKQAEGWAFLFLGADIDAFDAGAQLGIPRQNTVTYDTPQTAGTFNLVTGVTHAYRAGTVTYDNLIVTTGANSNISLDPSLVTSSTTSVTPSEETGTDGTTHKDNR